MVNKEWLQNIRFVFEKSFYQNEKKTLESEKN